LARAKNTSRAEARRRYRTQFTGSADPADTLAGTPADAPAAASLAAPEHRSMFRRPDVVGDIKAFPGMFRTRKLLWVPFLLVIGAFAVGLLINRGALPQGAADIGTFYVQLMLPPQALIAYFLAGFLAPRASYLVGLLLGLITGALYAVYIWDVPELRAQAIAAGYGFEAFLSTFVLQGLLFGTLAAAFAAWYRGFLRSSQERARQNRVAREQQIRERQRQKDREEREKQREARKTAAQKPSA
jgi:hypothetical protein